MQSQHNCSSVQAGRKCCSNFATTIGCNSLPAVFFNPFSVFVIRYCESNLLCILLRINTYNNAFSSIRPVKHIISKLIRTPHLRTGSLREDLRIFITNIQHLLIVVINVVIRWICKSIPFKIIAILTKLTCCHVSRI
ncbi:hypothetical protein D3C74_410250 [compost metagenome]